MTPHPKQVKTPQKAEVSYCPDYPAGQTKESLKEERGALMLEVSKKNNQWLINSKMEKTTTLPTEDKKSLKICPS